MFKKIAFTFLLFFVLINCVGAIDSSNWTTADIGYETFKIPPEYADNPYTVTEKSYMYDYDVDEFSIRYASPSLMSLFGYYVEKYPFKKVNVAGHDAFHFKYYDRHDEKNNSVLWFSSGEEFYFIHFRGSNITPSIKEVVKSSSESKFTKDEFYSILNEEYQNYKIVDAIESQRFDYPSNPKGARYTSFGPDGITFGSAYYRY